MDNRGNFDTIQNMKFKYSSSKLIFSTVLIAFCTGFIGNCSSRQPLTQSYIQQIIQNSSALPQGLEKTYNGCEVVPATGNKPQFEGQEFTGQTCFVKIHSDEKVEVSFLGAKTYSLSLLEENSDSFVTEINEDEVLIVQVHFHKKQILSVTHTNYDSNNHLNYGNSGEGQFIKACMMEDEYPSCTY